MERPNLFDFATSELSQDAFLCWLLSWAHDRHREADAALHGAGSALLSGLLALHGIDAPAGVRSLEVRRQHEDIDILVLVNGDIALAVEDKTDSSEHSDQLRRYLAALEADADLRGMRPAPVYLKTGDQCSYEAVEEASWRCFGRRDLLAVLDEGERLGAASDIFRDFHRRLRRIEDVANSWRLVPVADWGQDRVRWAGFFAALRERLGEGRWKYVNNASGGFMGFWWHWRGDKYLQLEEDRLCFKIMVEEKSEQAARWHEWYARLMAASVAGGLTIQKPGRRGVGTWMTVAVSADEYRQAGEGGLIDLDATVSFLGRAEGLLDAALAVPAGA